MRKILLITLFAISILLFGACGSTDSSTLNSQPQSTVISSAIEVAESTSSQDDRKTTPSEVDKTDNSSSGIDKEILELLKKAEKLEGSYFECEMTMMGETYTSKMWVEGSKTKTSVVMNNEEMVTIDTDTNSITYSKTTKQGFETITKESSKEQFNPTNIYDITESIKKIGEETINDYDCLVATSTDIDTNSNTKFWISKKYGIIVKMESKEPESGQTITMLYKNIKIGKLPDDIFKLPSDITIVKMPQTEVDDTE